MITMRALRTAAPLALAVVAALFTAAGAQTPSPKEPAKAKTPAKQQAKPVAAPATPSPAGPGGGQPTLLGQFGEWGAYAATAGGRKVCYAFAKPASSRTDPANRPRDPAYMFVSTRPAENVRNEVSIVVGYPFKTGSEAAADIGSSKYAMYTQADGAWIKNAAEEARMVETMRRGADMVITGESGRGTKSTDRYTLKGLAQALDRVAQECK
jgi:invasion protein IalB